MAVPIGFALAMSCVLTNRIVLNVRAINRGLCTESNPSTIEVMDFKRAQIYVPGTLPVFEMEELRNMRAEKPLGDVIELYEVEELPFAVL